MAEADVQVRPVTSLYVELLWAPEPGGAPVDLDLHLAHANAANTDLDGDGNPDPWFDPRWDCYSLNPTPDWTGGGVDDPSLGADALEGLQPEGIAFNAPEDGTRYAIGVHRELPWGCCSGEAPVDAIVRVYVHRALVFETTAALNVMDLWWVATVDWPGGQVSLKTAHNSGFWITKNYCQPNVCQP